MFLGWAAPSTLSVPEPGKLRLEREEALPARPRLRYVRRDAGAEACLVYGNDGMFCAKHSADPALQAAQTPEWSTNVPFCPFFSMVTTLRRVARTAGLHPACMRKSARARCLGTQGRHRKCVCTVFAGCAERSIGCTAAFGAEGPFCGLKRPAVFDAKPQQAGVRHLWAQPCFPERRQRD